jgi:hypothetical protein
MGVGQRSKLSVLNTQQHTIKQQRLKAEVGLTSQLHQRSHQHPAEIRRAIKIERGSEAAKTNLPEELPALSKDQEKLKD